jgi:predicted nuclease of predicted toxin-antitoxin system
VNFKIDENLPAQVAGLLQQLGHDAATVVQQHLGGSVDADIAAVCQQEERVLITLDLDFADVRSYPPEQFPGIIVLRLKQQDKPHVLKVVQHLIQALAQEPLKGHLWIVEEKQIRIRGKSY